MTDKPESEPATSNAPDNDDLNENAIEIAPRPGLQEKQADEQNDGGEDDDAGNDKHLYKVDDKPYSVFTHNEKRIIVICAGLCQFFSPISGQIYFPSLTTIAEDLHVSYSLVNLTITAYLVSSAMPKLRPIFHADSPS